MSVLMWRHRGHVSGSHDSRGDQRFGVQDSRKRSSPFPLRTGVEWTDQHSLKALRMVALEAQAQKRSGECSREEILKELSEVTNIHQGSDNKHQGH